MSKPLMKEYEVLRLRIERDDLAQEHDGKLVAIKGQEVLGIFDDYRQAANAVYVWITNTARCSCKTLAAIPRR